MATYIPNEVGQGIERASENVLRMLIEQSRMQQQESQFQRTMDLQERRFSEDQKVGALQRIQMFAPFLKGKHVSEAGFLHPDMQILFPESDPADETSLGVMRFGDLTFEEVMDQRKIALYDSLPEKTREKIEFKAISGTSPEALAIEEDQLGIMRTRLDQIMSDPETVRRLGNHLWGLPQQITASFPDGKGGMQTVTWSDEATARLSVSIWGMLQEQNIAAGKMASDQVTEMAKNLQEIAEEQGYGVPTHMARKIVQVVHSGDEEALDALMTGFSESGSTAGMAALEMYLTGADLAEGTSQEFFREFPELGLYVSIGKEIEGTFGKEQAASIMPVIAKKMREAGVEIGGPTGFGAFGSFDIGERRPPIRNTEPADNAPAQPSMEDMRTQMNSDAQAYADGDLSLQELVKKYGRSGAIAVTKKAKLLQGGGGGF